MEPESNLGPDAVTALGIAVTAIPTGRRLALMGELDIMTERPFVDALQEGLAHGDVEVDMTGLSFMDSCGVRALLLTREHSPEGRTVTVVAASPQARRLFDIVGVSEMIGLRDERFEPSPTLSGLQTHLVAVLSTAVHMIDECDTCSVTVRKGPHTYSAASFDKTAFDLDEAQYAEDSGPCLSALRSLEVVALNRIVAGAGRYEHFRGVAAAAGVRSSLSVPFKMDARLRGSLNLYSCASDAFGTDDEAHAVEFAATIGSLLAGDR